jgi:hypothetical protein
MLLKRMEQHTLENLQETLLMPPAGAYTQAKT